MTIALNKTVEMVANVLNAASWKIVTDGVTNGTTTLTSATAQFVPADVGKTLSVSGAGAAGAILLTSIAGYTSATQITMTDAATSTATAHTVSFGGRSEDPRHPVPEIIEAILEADAEECREILNDANNPRRASFIFTVSTLANKAQIPSHTGALGLVEIQHQDNVWRTGQPAPLYKILRWNQDATVFPATTAVTDGYYDASSGFIEFTGQSIRVTLFNFTKTTTPQAPDESQSNVVMRACRLLFAKEGDSPEAAQLMDKMGMVGLQLAGRPNGGQSAD